MVNATLDGPVARAGAGAALQAVDLVVVGAGLAGLCAALAGAQAGLDVLLLEKTARPGGSTALCSGGFAFAGTARQRALGIDDDAQRLAADLSTIAAHRNDPRTVAAYVRHQLAAHDWLVAQGVRFEGLSPGGGSSVARCHIASPAAVLDVLQRAALAEGVRLAQNSGVAALLSRDGRVEGVRLVDGRDVPARAGVVLCTGGFSRGDDLLAQHAPHLLGARRMGGAGNTGDGIRMAVAQGAQLVNMTGVKGTFGAPVRAPDELASRSLLRALNRGAILVDHDGRRFVDESRSYKVIGDACLRLPGAQAVQVFDAKVMAQSTPVPDVYDYHAALAQGLLVQADTQAQLAGQLGMDPAVLADTVARYNAACAGIAADPFGRASLGSGQGVPVAIDSAPFFACRTTTGVTSTFAGLLTDDDARVLDTRGRAIDGLYAAGEVSAGLFGDDYMSGTSLTAGCIFGRLAAAHATARTKNRQGVSA